MRTAWRFVAPTSAARSTAPLLGGDDPWGEVYPFDVGAARAEDLIDDGNALFEDLDGGEAGVGRVAVHHFEAAPLMRNTHGEHRDGDDHDARVVTGPQLVDILAQPAVALG